MAEEKHHLHNITMAAYAALLVGLLLQCVISTTIGGAGILIMLFGIVVVYSRRRKAQGTYLESHYRWMVRTFWIGGAILGLGMIISAGILISKLDMGIMHSQNQEQVNTMLYAKMAEHKFLLLAPQLPGILWWCWRCVKGMVVLSRHNPVYKPGDVATDAI